MCALTDERVRISDVLGDRASRFFQDGWCAADVARVLLGGQFHDTFGEDYQLYGRRRQQFLEAVLPDGVGYTFGVASLQGKRKTQEDAILCTSGRLPPVLIPHEMEYKPPQQSKRPWSLFIVADGHGGSSVAHKLCSELPSQIEAALISFPGEYGGALAKAILQVR